MCLSGWQGMDTSLMRAQRYRALALQLRATAENEADEMRRGDLLELANQYDGLAVNLVKKQTGITSA